jgi:hypothetical protein
MFLFILSGTAAGLLLLGIAGGAADTKTPASENGTPRLPASPSELFGAVARDLRPQWRPYFRETVPHSAGDRYKAALALGAVSADCYLAAEVRDAQQVRNLLTDMASLEMMLGITRQMGPLRQKVTSLAGDADWAGVRTEIASLMASHAKFLGEQKDGHLAELESIGCWLRTFHICARFASKQPAPPGRACIWSGALLKDLHARAAKLNAAADSKTLRTLNSGLEKLTKTWTGDTTAANAAARLAVTLPLLDSLVSELINDEPPPEESEPNEI